MTEKDYWTLGVTAAFTILAAVLGSLITLIWQDRQEKRKAKLYLFTTLMRYRRAGAQGPHPEWVSSLNLIDVVFYDSPGVLSKWHELYSSFVSQQAGTTTHHHTYIDMLSEMASELGFKKLKQTDIDKFYEPVSYSNQANANAQFASMVTSFFTSINKLIEEKKLTFTPDITSPSSDQGSTK